MKNNNLHKHIKIMSYIEMIIEISLYFYLIRLFTVFVKYNTKLNNMAYITNPIIKIIHMNFVL